jgi:hypothetical protein
VHVPAPDPLYVPAGHITVVALVDPAGHAYPWVHAAVQVDDVKPAVAPYRPGAQGPAQLELSKADTLPNCPAGQGVHTGTR